MKEDKRARELGVEPADARSETAQQVLAEYRYENQPEDVIQLHSAAIVSETMEGLNLPAVRLAQMKSALARALSNALAHADTRPVALRLLAPDKLDDLPGLYTGWGFFIIERTSKEGPEKPYPVVELFLYREGR